MDFRITGGAFPASASCASRHRRAQRHHLSPTVRPGNPGLAVIKSLPLDFVNCKNSSVITAHTTCVPLSVGPVLQVQSRKNPVVFSLGDEQGCNRPPNTFFV